MLTTSQVKNHFSRLDPQRLDLVLGLRDLVAATAPNATEVIQSKGLTYYYQERGGPVSAGICQILVFADHIRLAFNLGIFLPDPKNMLVGQTKAKRYIQLYTYDETPWDDLRQLIEASSRFDPYTLSF